MRGQISRDPLQVFSAGGPCEQIWHGQGCPLFDVVHTAFPLPTTASPTLQGALKDSFGEAVVACDRPKPCKFLSLDSCQRNHKEVDPAPHPESLVLLLIFTRQVHSPACFPLESLSLVFPVLAETDTGYCVGPQNEIRSHCLLQVPVLSTR